MRHGDNISYAVQPIDKRSPRKLPVLVDLNAIGSARPCASLRHAGAESAQFGPSSEMK